MFTKKQLGRFWRKVNASGPDECWEWRGAKRAGYGRLESGSVQWQAHRLSWTIRHGPAPKGLYVCHHCDNPGCVNPDHLFLGTAKDNHDDMLRKGRGNPCGFGIKLTESQVIMIKSSSLSASKVIEKFDLPCRVANISHIRTGKTWAHVT